MAIATEKICDMREVINKIDMAVFNMTNIFFVDYKFPVSQELLEQIQTYVVQMSTLIPDIRAYLDLVEIGIFDNIECVVDRFQLMESYIKTTDIYCGELLRELGM